MTDSEAEEAFEVVERLEEKFKEQGVKKIYLTDEGWKEDGSLPAQSRSSSGYSQVGPKGYKAGIIAEQQKINNTKRFTEALEEHGGYSGSELKEKVKKVGLQFETVYEQRAFDAIQKLLDHTNYGRNPNSKYYIEPTDTHRGQPLPRLQFKWSEYYENFDTLERQKDGKFRGRQVEKAREAFEKLQEPFEIAYRLKEGDEYRTVVVETPLIQQKSTGYEEVTEKELGDEPESKATKVVITVSPLFIERIDTMHWYKPEHLHEEIQEALDRKGRPSVAIENFITHMGIKNFSHYKIEERKLMKEVGLGGYLERSQISRARKSLNEAIDIAKELDFLLDLEKYENDKGQTIYQLWPNPARYSRIKPPESEEIEEG